MKYAAFGQQMVVPCLNCGQTVYQRCHVPAVLTVVLMVAAALWCGTKIVFLFNLNSKSLVVTQVEMPLLPHLMMMMSGYIQLKGLILLNQVNINIKNIQKVKKIQTIILKLIITKKIENN